MRHCLPARLRAAGVHTAFYTTSAVGFQRQLGFDSIWSGVEAFPVRSHKRNSHKIRWPSRLWQHNASRLRPDEKYVWLGHHDVYGLPAVRDFVAARGTRRFFLHLLTVATHKPYGGQCPSPTGGASGLDWVQPTLARMPRPPLHDELNAYLREIRCADWYVQQIFGILERAGRLSDTSVIVTADHGEGFNLQSAVQTARHARIDHGHGGSVYETQSRLPFVAFGPIAKGMPKRIDGIWSDTIVAPTVVEALTGSSHAIGEGMQPPSAPSTSKPTLATPIRPQVSDLYGHSVLSSRTAHAKQAFMGCAMDSTCTGLVVQNASTGMWTKFIAWASYFGIERLEAFNLSDDAYEDHDQVDSIDESVRSNALKAMHSWLRAVQGLHRKGVLASGGGGARTARAESTASAPVKLHLQ